MMSADGWEEIAGAIERWITNVPEGAATSTTEASG